jgi:thiol-disulfide isomerase/thioredoxin
MKKLLLGALAITIASCTNTAPVDYALFSGTIKNSESKKLIIRNSENKSIREITLSDTGVFSDTIFNAGGYVSFFNGKESSAMYVKNGDNITLNMDAKEFDETVAYTGSAASNFLAQKFLVKEKSGSVKDLYSLDEAAYLSKMNTQKETLEKSLTGLDADFVKQEKVNLKYDHIAHVKDYQPAHRYFAKKKDFKVSESFPDVLEGIDYSNEDHFKSSAAYKGLVMNNFYKMVGEKSKKNETSFSEAAIAYIKTSKSALMNNAFLSAISREVSGGNSKMKELYTDIMALSTDDDFKKKLTKQYEKALKLAKGNVSPQFVNYENNAGGTTSLSDLKGKYVYVDVWATWCGPCKAEIPFLQKVEKKYHGKNIEFVSLSIDVAKDHGKWKQMIKDKKLGGIQLFADSDWKSKFVTDYGITGIPRFILIDPSGNIVSSSAPRPSNKKLVELFTELKI